MEWVIGLLVLVFVVGMLSNPGTCDVCGLGIKKKSYTWEIDGKKQKLCPKCNSRMESKVSRDAFKNKFG